MSQETRARKFDGFDRPAAGAVSVPESGLDRIYEALTRSRRYLPQAIETKLSELWDRDTALAFALLLALWAGLQFTPAGWLADLLLLAYGLASIGSDLADVAQAAKGAADAETDPELETAAQQLAEALTESAADVIAGVIGGLVFAKVRRLVRLSRAKLLPRRFAGAGESGLKLGDGLGGIVGGVALGSGSVALAKEKKELEKTASWVAWGVAAACGVVLVGAGVAVARRGNP